jgi:N-acetylmuramoyl-L-alanine amidase
MVRDLVGDFLNGTFVLAIVLVLGLQVYPAPNVRADTTGVMPEFNITNYKNVGPDDYIFATSLIEGVTQREIHCLTENMYHEARSDGYAGMYAVAMVTLNRVADPRYPNDICEVVYQGPVKESWKTKQYPDLDDSERVYYPRKHRCQFSWYCDGKSDKMYDSDAFWRAVEIANMVLEAASGKYPIIDITEGSTHYHTIEVAPDWRHDRGMMKISRIGDHIFYRWEIL